MSERKPVNSVEFKAGDKTLHQVTSKTLRISTAMSALVMGFNAYSFIPRPLVESSSIILLYPVQRIIGTIGRICSILRARSAPVIPGMVWSVITKSNLSGVF